MESSKSDITVPEGWEAEAAGRKSGGNLLVVGEQESRDARRKQEMVAADSLQIDIDWFDVKDPKTDLMGVVTAKTTRSDLRFAEDWSLFSAISVAMRRNYGFWCVRVPRNSTDFVAIHQPEKLLVAVDPLQICRLSHNVFNTQLFIKLNIFPSQASYYDKKASERKKPRTNVNGRA
jgi:hypothetical protein